jgi:phosphoserine phosphatase RsbU/P
MSLRTWWWGAAGRPARLALALLYVGATTTYAALWMYAVRHPAPAYLGIRFDVDEERPGYRVRRVEEGSPAAAAGLRPGDRIVRVEGRVARDALLRDLLRARSAGEPLSLEVDRPGAGRLSLAVVTAPPPTVAGQLPLPRWIANELLALYPVPFLVVGMTVLLLRVDDRNAWLLALLFGGLIAGAPLVQFLGAIPEALHLPAFLYMAVLNGSLPGVFLYFFSVFPTRSPLDRRWPRLKGLWLALGVAGSVAVALAGLLTGDVLAVADLGRRMARTPLVAIPVVVFTVGGLALGLSSLVWAATRGDTGARRKSRVILWGTVLGFSPSPILWLVARVMHREVYDFPFAVWAPSILAMFLMPLSFAYAVVRHRVFGVPALLRRSARYLLVQRGSLGLLLLGGVGATLLFAFALSRLLQPGWQPAAPAAVGLGAGFGTVLIWSGARVHRRVRERIDRAFFRRAYDARALLHDLAERAGAAQSREDLAALLDHHLRGALLPRSLWLYLESAQGVLEPIRRDTPAATLPLVQALVLQGQPKDVRPQTIPDPAVRTALLALDVDCVVPITGRQRRLVGVLVLGPPLSEEPYSGEDKRLMATVAGQAGIALESIHLAELMSARVEVERRAVHEMELAQRVQARLLPQDTIPLRTLQYAGRCLQARAVGGDYYDYLDLGPGRVGLALADVSGKGFPAALLMANLQASLRSRSAQDMLDLPRQLHSVNQLLERCSEPNRYATLFLGVYDDATRRLRYANCGHNPPMVVRGDGTTERLLPTAPVLGLLREWECTTAEVALEPGDLLALFSDGVTEAFSDAGEEFGDERLLHALREGRHLPLPELLDRVVARVQAFSGSEQEDDLTLVVGRVS